MTYQFRCPVVQHGSVWPTVEPMNGCSVWQQRSLKSALWEGPGEKKSDWKWKTFPERQHSSTPSAPPTAATRSAAIGPLIIPAALRLAGTWTRWLMPVPSVIATYPAEKRWDFTIGVVLNESTVRPFRGRTGPGLLDVLTCYIKQINNQEESCCLMWSRYYKKSKRKSVGCRK